MVLGSDQPLNSDEYRCVGLTTLPPSRADCLEMWKPQPRRALKACPLLYLLYKGKAAPLQAWSGPEGSRNLRFPDFMTTAQDGGKVVSLTHWPPLHPGNTPGTHFC
jgi:hypothetical protein